MAKKNEIYLCANIAMSYKIEAGCGVADSTLRANLLHTISSPVPLGKDDWIIIGNSGHSYRITNKYWNENKKILMHITSVEISPYDIISLGRKPTAEDQKKDGMIGLKPSTTPTLKG